MHERMIKARLYFLIDRNLHTTSKEECYEFKTRQRIEGFVNFVVLSWYVCIGPCDYAARCYCSVLVEPVSKYHGSVFYRRRVADPLDLKDFVNEVMEKVKERWPNLVW